MGRGGKVLTSPRLLLWFACAVALSASCGSIAFAQSTVDVDAPAAQQRPVAAPVPQRGDSPCDWPRWKRPRDLYCPNEEAVTFRNTPRHFLEDQRDILTSPLRTRWQDARYLVPLATFTGLLIGSDHHTATVLVHPGVNDPHRAQLVADAGVGALGLLGVGMLFNGVSGDIPHQKEAGLLSMEALADTMVENNLGRVILTRERPGVDGSQGKFFTGGGFSMPSNHAAAAWSLASVLGEEYPGPLSRFALYSAAAAVSISRIAGEQHFPSDVLVGSATGWLIGRYVYRARHDDRLTADFRSADPAPSGPDAEKLVLRAYTPGLAQPYPAQNLQASESHLGDVAETPPQVYVRHTVLDADSRGSVYVPMDSWVYTALSRLWSLGFVPSQSSSIRPWTRVECLRQTYEAEAAIQEILRDRTVSPGSERSAEEGARLTGALKREFGDEMDSYEKLQLDSVYSRDTTIAGGPALMRSWDFGQSLDNDYGRAFARGTNLISGFSVSATSGRWSFYTREEYQHAPGYSTYPPNIYDFITGPIDGNIDVPPATGDILTVNRQRPLEMYAGVEAGGYEFQLGKQELYWGPSQDAPLSWSINAEPTYNFQVVSTRPHGYPEFLSWLGTWRADFVVGKMSGHTTPARPWFNGQKLSLDFTPNLEMSLTRWSLWAGVGSPLTLGNFFYNLFSFSSNLNVKDPGDRKSGFDFRYRLPYMRWITVYADSYADDEVTPLDSPRRSAWAPGIYFAHLPGLPHVDLRVEVPSTLLFSSDHGADFIYINDHYVDANLNKKFFVGNSVGRDSRRYEGWTSYWFSGQDRIELGYRQTQRSSQFLQYTSNPAVGGGGTQSDAMLRGSWALSEHWNVKAMAQYERWYEPLLNTTAQHNITGQVELRWEPKLNVKR